MRGFFFIQRGSDAGVDRWICFQNGVHQTRDSGRVKSYKSALCTGPCVDDVYACVSADLVPVFSFGENDVRLLSPILALRAYAFYTVTHQIYEQMPNEKGTTLFKIQKKFQNAFGFTLPLFHGRGILNCEASRPSRHALGQTDSPSQIIGDCFRTAGKSSPSVSSKSSFSYDRTLDCGLIFPRQSVGRSMLRRRTTRLSNKSGKCKRRI